MKCFGVKMLFNFWAVSASILLFTRCAHAVQDDNQKGCLVYNPEKNCEDNGIKFYLRVSSNEASGSSGYTEYTLSTSDTETIKRAGFIEKQNTKVPASLQPIKFIIHGHNENSKDFLVMPILQEYIKLNYNVILIEYTKLSEDPCYITGIQNSPHIAKCATEMLEKISHNIVRITLKDFHIIGLSLGVQISGQMPNYLSNKDVKFSRITGIEPANEGFYDKYEKDEFILTKNDADYVDIVHTNSGFMGKFLATGHADFYANSGILQPGCPIGNNFCSHMRAVVLFLETIGDEQLQVTADKCSSLEKRFNDICETLGTKVTFGEHAIKYKPEGIFFFKTRDKSTEPYIGSNKSIVSYPVYSTHVNFKTPQTPKP